MFTNGECAAIRRAMGSAAVQHRRQFYIVWGGWFPPCYMLADEISDEELLFVGTLQENGKWRVRKVAR